jgi:hypothetical protein
VSLELKLQIMVYSLKYFLIKASSYGCMIIFKMWLLFLLLLV